MAILNHDFIETNADTFSLTIPFLIKNCYHFYAGHKTDDNLLFDSYILSLCVFVALTNEFHKVRKFYSKNLSFREKYKSYNRLFYLLNGWSFFKNWFTDFSRLPRPLQRMGKIFSKRLADFTPWASSHSSRSTTLNLLLHYDRVVRSPPWIDWLLAAFRIGDL